MVLPSITEYVEQNLNEFKAIARTVRGLCLDTVFKSHSGHIGAPLGCAEIATLLYFTVMHYDSSDPQWLNRDRFVLSNGHASALQYVLLHLAGYSLNTEDLKQFRQWGSRTPGHPEVGHTPGVECTTGPLGQGLAMAVGMALSERLLNARFGSVFDHRTFVLMGDGCLMEGISHEVMSFAGRMRLNRLIALYDDNNITIDGPADLSCADDVEKRCQAYGWQVLHADGHCFVSLAQALDKALLNSRLPNGTAGPVCIICKTTAGKGALVYEGQAKIHGNPLKDNDVVQAKQALGVPAEPFSVPLVIYEICKKWSAKRAEIKIQWDVYLAKQQRLWTENSLDKMLLWKRLFEEQKKDFLHQIENKWTEAKSTRVWSGEALQWVAGEDPAWVGGSADLAESNCSFIKNSTYISPHDFSGANIAFGVREHGMAAICNGINLHNKGRGLRAYCATFLVFSDYMRPAIRLAALMQLPTVFLFTHDSFCVGEDGPTHQPIEQLPSLRLIPGLQVIRPADGQECFEAWAGCGQQISGPVALVLSRQNVNSVTLARSFQPVFPLSGLGVHLIAQPSDTDGVPCVFLASGSEVGRAVQVVQHLKKLNIKCKTRGQLYGFYILSAPLWPFHIEQLYAHFHWPKGTPLIVWEACCASGFAQQIPGPVLWLGWNQFGASAKESDLILHFGFESAFVSARVAEFLQEV